MLRNIESLPALIHESFESFDEAARAIMDGELSQSLKRIYVTGCGDSHHAALTTELAFELLAGIPIEAMTAMQFARYTASHLPESGPGSNLLIGISVSGEVARTVEAIMLARQAGASTIALTATPGSRLAQAAERALLTTVSPFPDPPASPTPGIRSFAANQLMLFLLAVALGELRRHLDRDDSSAARREILALADAAEATIAACGPVARNLAGDWMDAQEFVYLGSGPNYGTALFSAAKLLEATGDSALGQDTEEWAHLQYFARSVATPTFIICAGERDLSRAVEVAVAARTIGRRVAVVAPRSAADLVAAASFRLPLPEGVREMFSPLIAAIPAELFAAHRAELLGELYFRGFGGGRGLEEGGGISRIRTSAMWESATKGAQTIPGAGPPAEVQLQTPAGHPRSG